MAVLAPIDPSSQSVKGQLDASGLSLLAAISLGESVLGTIDPTSQSVKGVLDPTGQTVLGAI